MTIRKKLDTFIPTLSDFLEIRRQFKHSIIFRTAGNSTAPNHTLQDDSLRKRVETEGNIDFLFYGSQAQVKD